MNKRERILAVGVGAGSILAGMISRRRIILSLVPLGAVTVARRPAGS